MFISSNFFFSGSFPVNGPGLVGGGSIGGHSDPGGNVGPGGRSDRGDRDRDVLLALAGAGTRGCWVGHCDLIWWRCGLWGGLGEGRGGLRGHRELPMHLVLPRVDCGRPGVREHRDELSMQLVPFPVS